MKLGDDQHPIAYSDQRKVSDQQKEIAESLIKGSQSFVTPISPGELPSTKMIPFPTVDIEKDENQIFCPIITLGWSDFKKVNDGNESSTSFTSQIEATQFSKADINPEDYISYVGARDDKKLDGMISDFGLAREPKLFANIEYENIVFCAMKKRLPFLQEFEAFALPLQFKLSDNSRPVRAFGVTSDWDHWGNALDQITVLDYRSPDDFIIKISNLKNEDLILAKMPMPESVADGIQTIDDKITTTKIKADGESVTRGEQVVIPILDMSLIEDFTIELSESSSRVQSAQQLVQFRLDEKGAELIAQFSLQLDNGHYEYKVGERTFIFDKPFMILLRESDKQNPYFAGWIANTDLMIAKN